jgi:hypothetical protein
METNATTSTASINATPCLHDLVLAGRCEACGRGVYLTHEHYERQYRHRSVIDGGLVSVIEGEVPRIPIQREEIWVRRKTPLPPPKPAVPKADAFPDGANCAFLKMPKSMAERKIAPVPGMLVLFFPEHQYSFLNRHGCGMIFNAWKRGERINGEAMTQGGGTYSYRDDQVVLIMDGNGRVREDAKFLKPGFLEAARLFYRTCKRAASLKEIKLAALVDNFLARELTLQEIAGSSSERAHYAGMFLLGQNQRGRIISTIKLKTTGGCDQMPGIRAKDLTLATVHFAKMGLRVAGLARVGIRFGSGYIQHAHMETGGAGAFMLSWGGTMRNKVVEVFNPMVAAREKCGLTLTRKEPIRIRKIVSHDASLFMQDENGLIKEASK